MRTMNKGEIDTAAKSLYNTLVASYGLANAKKVVFKLKRLVKNEVDRRKGAEK